MNLICWIIGWSDQDLADELEVSRVTVIKLKNGAVKIRKIQYLAIINLIGNVAQTNQGKTYKFRRIILWVIDHIYHDYEQEEFEYFRNAISEVVRRTGRKVGMEKIHENVIQEASRILEEYGCLRGGEWQ